MGPRPLPKLIQAMVAMLKQQSTKPLQYAYAIYAPRLKWADQVLIKCTGKAIAGLRTPKASATFRFLRVENWQGSPESNSKLQLPTAFILCIR